jgi:hypothetical protein
VRNPIPPVGLLGVHVACASLSKRPIPKSVITMPKSVVTMAEIGDHDDRIPQLALAGRSAGCGQASNAAAAQEETAIPPAASQSEILASSAGVAKSVTVVLRETWGQTWKIAAQRRLMAGRDDAEARPGTVGVR